MQIHELNNYIGNLDSSAYLAVDNGSDTGKVSARLLLAATNAEIEDLELSLNERIDNIIAGGDAPSEAEIIDARRGADGVDYTSLGTAIRTQFTNLESNVEYGVEPLPTIIQGDTNSAGQLVTNTKRIRTEGLIPVKKGHVLQFKGGAVTRKFLVNKYATDMSYLGATSFYVDYANYEVDYDGFAIIIFAKNDISATIAPTDYDATTNHISVNGVRVETLEDLSNSIEFLEYPFKASEVSIGTLQINNNSFSNDTSAFGTPYKIPLDPGEVVEITPQVPTGLTDVDVYLRVGAYANGSMDGTAGATIENLTNIGTSSYTITQIDGYAYILVGVYYKKHSDSSAITDIVNQFSPTDIALTISKKKYRKPIVYLNDYYEHADDNSKITYIGLCSQSGNVGYELVNTRIWLGQGFGRAVTRITVNEGDKIEFGVSDAWNAAQYQYQYIYTDTDNIIIKSNSGSFTTANKADRIKFKAEYSGYVFIAIRPTSGTFQAALITDAEDWSATYLKILPISDETIIDCNMVCDNMTVYKDDGVMRKLSPVLSTQFCIHRGWNNAPDNTLQAFWNAKKNGYSLMEGDVRVTSDGVPVLAHDATITGKLNGVSTTYTIANETYDTLKQLVLSDSYPDCHVPSVDDVLSFGRCAKIKYLFDCKILTDQMAIDLMALVKKYHMVNDVIFNTNGDTSMADKFVSLDENVNLLFPITANTTTYDTYLNREGETYLSASISAIGNTLSVTEYYELSEKGFIMGVWNVSNTNISAAVDLTPYFIEMTDATKSSYDWFDLVSSAIKNKYDVVF